MIEAVRRLARRWLPSSLRGRIARSLARPPVGSVRFGDLRRLEPISRQWGFERGTPVDRHYIEVFLAEHSAHVRGRVLEIGNDRYTRRFGGDRVERRDVLHVLEGWPGATLTGDLARGDGIPSEAFDCIVLTQTLQAIFDLGSTVETLHRILAPGGTLLATVPGISKVSLEDLRQWGYYWAFTSASVRRLFEERFPAREIDVITYGNVLSSIAFLHGVAAEELSPEELAHVDPEFELLIGLRARKPDARE